MSRVVAIMSVAAILAAGPAFAQEVAPGPGTVEVTLIPGGATFFTSKDAGPEFGNYTYGGAVALNFNRYVGIEGEAGGTVGIAQDLTFRGSTANLKPPNMLTYNGNVVLNVAAGHSVVPFVTGGVGGLTMFERTELSINDTQTFLTGNVGGGVKWYAPNGRWGLRADYRFIAVRSKDDAPDFFGQDTRYGHRVYGAVVINAVR
jgi:Outer membrane protein beta-barrel domain